VHSHNSQATERCCILSYQATLKPPPFLPCTFTSMAERWSTRSTSCRRNLSAPSRSRGQHVSLSCCQAWGLEDGRLLPNPGLCSLLVTSAPRQWLKNPPEPGFMFPFHFFFTTQVAQPPIIHFFLSSIHSRSTKLIVSLSVNSQGAAASLQRKDVLQINGVLGLGLPCWRPFLHL
jgi:hypothetical protein